MELRRELMFTVGALVVLNVLLAFGAIGLFARMGPAIDRIMQDNVYSIEAVEEILSELTAVEGGEVPEEGRLRIRHAIARARGNVTERDEDALLDSLEADLEEALTGDGRARARVAREGERLILVNREVMRAVDREARRLGRAGAWVAALVGVFSFVFSLFVVGRLRSRFLAPLEELHDVLERTRAGDPHRRCRSREAPREVRRVAEAVNRLLDERMGGGGVADGG